MKKILTLNQPNATVLSIIQLNHIAGGNNIQSQQTSDLVDVFLTVDPPYQNGVLSCEILNPSTVDGQPKLTIDTRDPNPKANPATLRYNTVF